MVKPLSSTAGMKTPMTVPITEPVPPNRLVPPRTTAAMAFRLSCVPLVSVVLLKCARFSTPARPASRPDSA